MLTLATLPFNPASQVVTRGEELIGVQRVWYDRTLKETIGAPRANVVGSGSNRVSLIQCVAADGFVCDPAFFSSGKFVQVRVRATKSHHLFCSRTHAGDRPTVILGVDIVGDGNL